MLEPDKILWQHVSDAAPVHIAITHINNDYSRPLHHHDFAEFFLVESGQGQHLLTNGEHALEAGDLVFVAAEHQHSLRAEDLQIVNIAFPSEILTSCAQVCPALAALYAGLTPSLRKSTHLQRERLRYWMQELRPSVATSVGVHAMLLDLMRAGFAPTRASNPPQWLEQALWEIAEPPLLAEGMQALVTKSGRSREYIWRQCKQFYQQSPQQLINALRMEYAERRLRLSTDSILHICYDCGLSNISHFYRMFQKSSGMTPKRYRDQHHQAIT